MLGQGLVFELVLLFAISIGILLVLFAVFNVYQSHYGSVAAGDQLSSIKNIISSTILELASKEGNGSVKVRIPERIGSELYKIDLTQEGINVSTLESGIYSFSSLFSLNETYQFSGRSISTSAEVIIIKSGNQISIL